MINEIKVSMFNKQIMGDYIHQPILGSIYSRQMNHMKPPLLLLIFNSFNACMSAFRISFGPCHHGGGVTRVSPHASYTAMIRLNRSPEQLLCRQKEI